MSGIVEDPIGLSPHPAFQTGGAPIAARRGGALFMVGALASVDWLWNLQVGLTVAGWGRAVIAVAFLALIGLFYGTVRVAPRLAGLATYGALWIAFTAF